MLCYAPEDGQNLQKWKKQLHFFSVCSKIKISMRLEKRSLFYSITVQTIKKEMSLWKTRQNREVAKQEVSISSL